MIANLRDSLSKLLQEFSLSELVLYGSATRSNLDAASDIDVLGLRLDECPSLSRLICLDDLVFDLHIHSFSSAIRVVNADVRTNNNHLLFACATGLPFVGSSTQVESLLRGAREIWHRGPRCVTTPEREELLEALVKAKVTIMQLLARTRQQSRSENELVVKACTIFTHAILLYCRANRLWACSFEEMLRWSEPAYAEIQTALRVFLGSSALESKLIVTSDLIDRSIGAVDKSAEQEQALGPSWRQRLSQIEALLRKA